MDDYDFLEPTADDMPLDDYLDLLDNRYTGLQDTAQLYAEMLEAVDGNGTKGRLIQHWKKYTAAASTIHRVKYELAAYGKLPDEYGADVEPEAVASQDYRPVPD